MDPLEPTISTQIEKYPILAILGLSQTIEKCKNRWSKLSDIPNMSQVFEQIHLNRFRLHLGTMVNEKQDRWLFVTTLGVLSYNNQLPQFLGQTVGPAY